MGNQINAIWAVNDGEKVLRGDLDNPHKAANSVWDGKRIRLFGGRNETVAFQLMIESGETGVSGLTVEMSALTHESDLQLSIHNEQECFNDPNHYTGKRIEVFTEHYLYVSPEISTAPQWFYAASAPPAQRTGWIPDALIPHNAHPGRGGQPVSVLPRVNQGFWIDIYVPDDVSLKQGLYSGYITVKTDGGGEWKLPVDLELYAFTLPHENHTRTIVYASDIIDYYPDLHNPMDALRKMAHRHRFDLIGSDVHNRKFDSEALEEYLPYLNGDFYSEANGYEGAGQNVGERTFPIGMYGSPVLGDTPGKMVAEADKWVKWFDSLDWPGTYFYYLIDEPRPDKYDWINEQARIIKSSTGAGRRLPLLTTRTYTPEITESIDIWCAFKIEAEAKAHCSKSGQGLWFYNGYRPYHGSLILEGDAVDLRVNSWLRWRYDIDCYFIWHGTHWRHNFQGPRGRLPQNVFAYPVTFMHLSKEEEDMYFGKPGAHWGNGDGILFYPGSDPFFCEQDRGINGPISSIRMKNLRRGIQDFEYMWLAEQNGKRTEVDDVVCSAVPKAMYETDGNQQISWSACGNDWDERRKQIAELIVASSKGNH
jgi:hypothetical protein